MAYRISRNCEASLIDWITEELSDAGWTGIRVEKSFAQVYKGTLPCILIEQDPEDDTKLEIGSKTWLKNFSITKLSSVSLQRVIPVGPATNSCS